MSQENVETVRGSLEGWNRGDIDVGRDRLTRHRVSDLRPLSGNRPGLPGACRFRRFWTTFREPWESLQIHVDQVRDLGDEVLVLGTFEGRARDGMIVEREVAWIFRFVDGLATRAEGYAAWKEALEAAGLEE